MTDTLLVWLVKRCKEPAFQQFLGAADEQDAVAKARAKCAITSRSQLNTDPAAIKRFHEAVRLPFIKFTHEGATHV